jgi:hypothetical protein
MKSAVDADADQPLIADSPFHSLRGAASALNLRAFAASKRQPDFIQPTGVFP